MGEINKNKIAMVDLLYLLVLIVIVLLWHFDISNTQKLNYINFPTSKILL